MTGTTQLIIFDLDGTLVNAYPAVSQSVNHCLARLGFPLKSDHAIKRAVGFGDRHLMAGFIREALADRAIRIYRPHHKRALIKPGGLKFLLGAKSALR